MSSMGPPKLPASFDGLLDDLDDVDINGEKSARLALAHLADAINKQRVAIVAQNRCIRDVGEYMTEIWRYARDANRRSEENEKRTVALKSAVLRAGQHVESTGSIDLSKLPSGVKRVVESHERDLEDRRKLVFSIKEKLVIGAIVTALILMAFGAAYVVFTVAHRGPAAIPTLTPH